MLLVDDRIGSNDLVTPLQRLGIPAELARLEFGDLAFMGVGRDDVDIQVGIELKETKDLISSMRSERFSGHQLPGLQRTYDRVWLIVEGIWRAGDEGVLEIMAGGWRPVSLGKNRVMASDVEQWLLTQIICGGINFWHASTRRDTLRFVAGLYHWWTNGIESHKSHQVIYQPPPDRVALVEPSNFVKGLTGLVDDLGWVRAHAIEGFLTDTFGPDVQGSRHIAVLSSISAKDLQQIDGIGKKLSERIVSALH
jgi:hypothetical protein